MNIEKGSYELAIFESDGIFNLPDGLLISVGQGSEVGKYYVRMLVRT